MSKRLKIGVDFDDVLADLMPAWLGRYNAANGTKWTPADLTQWDVWKDLGCEPAAIYQHLTPDIYDDVQPVPDALDALHAIEKLGHDVIVVTSVPGDGPAAMAMAVAKSQWMERHGLGVQAMSMVCVGPSWGHKTKATVSVDWLIDDNIGNVEAFPGYGVVVTRPHNRAQSTFKKRVRGLQDVVPLLAYERVPQPIAAPPPANPMFYTEPAQELRKPAGSLLDRGAAREQRMQEIAAVNRAELPQVPAHSDAELMYNAGVAKAVRDFAGKVDGGGYKASMDDPRKLPLWLVPPRFYSEATRFIAVDLAPDDAFYPLLSWVDGGDDSLLIDTVDALCVTYGNAEVVRQVAAVLRHGAKKYAANNWRRGMAFSEVASAALRHHLGMLTDSYAIDPESGLPHWAHFACCVAFLLEYTEHRELYGKFDDRYKRPEAAA